ncbi:MAG TPA: metallophosphoesterase [Thermoplasmata archaeon]|nr:metallophosphoesterase [Thermoplasmata archaeon]
MAKPTRLLFVADLHGSAVCFRKFVNAAKVYRADVLIVGGDIAAKTMTPVFEGSGSWSATVEGETRTARSTEELERIEGWLRDSATVPIRTTAQAWRDLVADRPRAEEKFQERVLVELKRWLDWARARLVDTRTRLLLGLGNDDFTPMEGVIASDGRAELTDGRVLRVDDHHELLTLPYSNPTPWNTNRELSEEEIGRRLNDDIRQLERVDRAVFNLHVPPFGTPLDLAPRLGPGLVKVMAPGGEPDMVHVGSTAVRAAIERYQPLLGLHGHIHESKGSVSIGRTLSLNPGSAYTEGTLLGTVVDLDPDGIRATMMTTG